VLSLLLLASCGLDQDSRLDADGDGFSQADGDCDDDRADVFPGAPERCGDGVLNDCEASSHDCGLTGELPLGDADLHLESSDPWTGLELAVELGGDWDGDGLADLALGMPGATVDSLDQGAVYLFLGPQSGERWVEDADATLFLSSATSNFGLALSSGDLDGDGLDELLVNSNSWDDDDPGHAGEVFVYRGPFSGTMEATAALTHVSPSADSSRLGGALSVNGAGETAMLLTDSGWSLTGESQPGSLFLFWGLTKGEVSLDDADVVFTSDEPLGQTYEDGVSADHLVDLDGDGLLDAIVQDSCGMVFQGPLAGTYAPQDADLSVALHEDSCGRLDWLVDWDQDGRRDLVSFVTATGRGRVDVLCSSGGDQADIAAACAHLDATDGSTDIYQSVALGDLDGDGVGDVAHASSREDWSSQETVAHVHYGGFEGRRGATEGDLQIVSASLGNGGDSAPHTLRVALGPDADGDLAGEFFVGLYWGSDTGFGDFNLFHGTGP